MERDIVKTGASARLRGCGSAGVDHDVHRERTGVMVGPGSVMSSAFAADNEAKHQARLALDCYFPNYG